MILKANAKINLGLQVLEKRSDNFHNINSIFLPINLYDELEFESSDTIELNTNIDLKISERENLVFQAITKIQKKYKVPKGIKVKLTKNIPTGAGLGGGSSDAAFAIKGCLEFWNLTPNYSDLLIIAQSLGSDIPFFLNNQPALVTGKGEKLLNFDFNLEYKLLLIFPNIHVNTAEAYRMLNRQSMKYPRINFYKILQESKSNVNLLKEFFVNDFEKPVFKSHPILKEIKEEQYAKGALFASMSGSGSAIYGFYDDDDKLNKAKEIFKEYQVFVL